MGLLSKTTEPTEQPPVTPATLKLDLIDAKLERDELIENAENQYAADKEYIVQVATDRARAVGALLDELSAEKAELQDVLDSAA